MSYQGQCCGTSGELFQKLFINKTELDRVVILALSNNKTSSPGLTKTSFCIFDTKKQTILQDLIYPVIIKDPCCTGSKNVWLAENATIFEKILSDISRQDLLKEVLIETYIQGTLFRLETISFNGNVKTLAVTNLVLSDMPLFMELAFSLQINTNCKELNGVEDWIAKILNAVSYKDGYAYTDFIVTANGFEVVEVKPRLGGWQIGEALYQSFNYNFYKEIIEIALGRKPEVFDLKLRPMTNIGLVNIYAKNAGLFSKIISKYINKEKPHIYPIAYEHKLINNIIDQGTMVGVLLTHADSSEIALLNVLAEANKLEILMDSADV
ncbi:acetyl-CoA carboxylase biotin carboxylase subunit family protein [Bartonella sp. DGB1]|uniref:ATP-grasp domain-containing protein n=1 Tax=Bartonella sp. DGB1 TaxID=3239807 RepID=UPI003524BF19